MMDAHIQFFWENVLLISRRPIIIKLNLVCFLNLSELMPNRNLALLPPCKKYNCTSSLFICGNKEACSASEYIRILCFNWVAGSTKSYLLERACVLHIVAPEEKNGMGKVVCQACQVVVWAPCFVLGCWTG